MGTYFSKFWIGGGGTGGAQTSAGGGGGGGARPLCAPRAPHAPHSYATGQWPIPKILTK